MSEIQLAVLDGPDAGKEFDLSGATTVGRDPSAGIVIDDPESSRRHASLSVEGSTVTVEDLGSTNGTFVNGERLTAPRELSGSEKVRVGTTVFEVRVGAEDPQATRAGTSLDLDDLQVTAPRQVPEFAGVAAGGPVMSGAPGGSGGAPGGGDSESSPPPFSGGAPPPSSDP